MGGPKGEGKKQATQLKHARCSLLQNVVRSPQWPLLKYLERLPRFLTRIRFMQSPSAELEAHYPETAKSLCIKSSGAKGFLLRIHVNGI